MKVSIITVCYNSEETIEKTIQSVINQTYTDLEYIIIDGDSNDKTTDIILNYKDKISYYISEPDKGIYHAMNKGIELSSGEIVAILNSDDCYINDKIINEVVKTFIEHDVDSIYTNLYLVDQKNTDKIIRNCTYNNYEKGLFFKGWHPPHPSLFLKKEVYDKFGKFDTTYKIASDYELMLRLFEIKSISSIYLPIYTIRMSNGGVSTSSLRHIYQTQKECLSAFKNHNLQLNIFNYFFLKYYQKIKQYKIDTFLYDLISKKINFIFLFYMV